MGWGLITKQAEDKAEEARAKATSAGKSEAEIKKAADDAYGDNIKKQAKIAFNLHRVITGLIPKE